MCNNPLPNMMLPNMMMPNMIPNNMQDVMMGLPFNNMNYNIDNNDINTKISALERHIRRMDERITKLEALYNNTNNNINEPDNSIYMM